ncbi:hypothetical protein CC85DRAFT_284138 [Cutaneotrichosporon oleaginosum]|uniref:Solute carrier family 40 member n=1 Tax=Cutaneotrichosporon oleaginosum TaxID=879819 RepID=A0A0J0XRZ6_9TREE|nr:uncharacterized protein CC85DRAFT_284138 [Cutaneotrichosporon oleaginosum]KLT43855.1 hypothetical protein CC85DRAFT_284138 [Cutaneotrichosporon oleaginosum]TXT06405.1 hypothetical protein COLE_05736 [Cutaneotrichosporon oleaginosum]
MSASLLHHSQDVELPLMDARRASTDAPPDSGDADRTSAAVTNTTRYRLYLSHLLSTWNMRVFEFGAVLYLAKAFPGTLLTMSIYAFVRGLSAIVSASAIGTYIDRNDRLHVVRTAIVGQRVSVAVSCVAFYILIHGDMKESKLLSVVLLVLVGALACVEKVCAIINTVAVEKDWVVVVGQSDPEGLKAINSQMRRIDLLCKLIGPMVIAILDGVSTELAILVNLTMNLLSVALEYFAIARVYHEDPRLQQPKNVSTARSTTSTPTPQGLLGHVHDAVAAFASDARLYCTHQAFLPSFACALLYLNVLTFGGQMVTYLLANSYTSTNVGIARTVSVVLEVASTWVAPRLMTAIGVTRAGIWSSWWQLSMLTTGVAVFTAFADRPLVSASALVCGTILSRMGLWSLDLCIQVIVQDDVEAESRGVFSSMESAFQNAFELLSYASTIVFFRPEQFKYPTMISLMMVFGSNFCYSIYVRRRRGHLFHPEKLCGCVKRDEFHPYVALPDGRSNSTSDNNV